MSNLIDRQAAIDAVNEWLKLYVINRTMSNITSIQDILRQLPSAQPEGKTYEDGWREGREALRREIWEDERERLD